MRVQNVANSGVSCVEQGDGIRQNHKPDQIGMTGGFTPAGHLWAPAAATSDLDDRLG